jgi:hypothetical protein
LEYGKNGTYPFRLDWHYLRSRVVSPYSRTRNRIDVLDFYSFLRVFDSS